MVLDQTRGIVRNGHQDLVTPEFLDALAVAVYTTDANGVITQFNQAAVELWGRRPVVGKDKWCGSWRLFTPDGTPMAHDDCPMAVTLRENRAVRGFEIIVERPNGTRAWFVPSPTPLHDADGNLVGAVNVLMDVTDRKRGEEAAAYLNAIIASSDDAIVSKDLNGIITSWNQGAERLFGYSGAEVVGRSIRTIIPPDRLGEEDEVLSRVRRGERVEHFETVRRRKDGSLVPISLAVSPVRDPSGRIIGASKIARDITERRESERAIAEAVAVKDEFIGLVSHELRTPLTTIMGNAGILSRRGSVLDVESRLAAAADIHQEAIRLNGIIDDLLSLARLDGGQIECEPTALVRQVQRSLGEHAVRSKREVELRADVPDLLVTGDQRIIGHVLNNYLSNAEKYSPMNSAIEVVVDCRGTEGRVRVLDRGIGFDVDEAERLFDSFYRAKNVGKVSGIGIGLSVCRRLIGAIAGTCWASPREGGGSEFGFSLPLYKGSEVED